VSTLWGTHHLDQSFSYTSPRLEDVYKLVIGKEITIGNEKYKVELCPHETAPQLLLQSESQFEQPLCFGMEGIMGEADYLYQFVIYEEEGKKKLDCRFGDNSWSINAYEYMVFVLRKI